MPFIECCIPSCRMTKYDETLYRITRNEKLQRKWLDQLAPYCPGLLQLSSQQLKERKICSRHFEPKYLIGKRRLYNAYPTLITKHEITTGIPNNPVNISVETDHTYVKMYTMFDHTYFKSPSSPAKICNLTNVAEQDYTSPSTSKENPTISEISDPCPPPSHTEDAIDNDNPLEFNFPEDDNTDKQLGTLQVTETFTDVPTVGCETVVEESIVTPSASTSPSPELLVERSVRKFGGFKLGVSKKGPLQVTQTFTDVPTVSCETVVEESTATVNAPTSPSPELLVESSVRKLSGFKLGVSEKVLQFRLVDDGDCDEPTYKVLKAQASETTVETTACSTEHDTVRQEKPSTTEDFDVEYKPEPKEHGKRKDKEYWKLKLTHILHKTKFCGICLNAEEDMNGISDEVEIVNCEITYRNTLWHIVDSVFKQTDYPLANSQVCESCTKKLIQSYMFIRSVEETTKTLNYYLDELYNKTCYIRNNDLKLNQAGSEIYNVVISLDQEIPKGFDRDIALDEEIPKDFDRDIALDEEIPKDFDCDIAIDEEIAKGFDCDITIDEELPKGFDCDIALEEIPKGFDCDITIDEEIPKGFNCDITPEVPKIAESKLNHPRVKRKLKCVTCNVILPSQRAWRVHERTTHRDKYRCTMCLQSFRTRQTAHFIQRRHNFDLSKNLADHRKRKHDKHMFPCNLCNRVFLNDTKKRKHLLQFHSRIKKRASRLHLVSKKKSN